jgi:hypothetical protein
MEVMAQVPLGLAYPRSTVDEEIVWYYSMHEANGVHSALFPLRPFYI